ncbi:MAG: ABC transporter permease [Planctomycetota bacterium]|jgi:oligopeptide transport system permease protein
MSARLLRRLATLLVTLLLVHAAAFFMMRATRGGPFDEARALDPQVQTALEARFGLDRPLGEQYLRALGGMLRGDFGPSLRYRDVEVSELLAAALPVSFALGAAAVAWGLLFGIPLGLLGAGARRRMLRQGADGVATLLLAMPNFVLAGAAIALFSFALGWLPPGGTGGFAHLVLPSLCLGLPLAAQVALLVRDAAAERLASPGWRHARALGLGGRRLWLAHVLKPSLTPVLAFLGPATAAVLTGSLVIERIFALPGLGTFFVEAALNRDYTLALGVTVVYTALLGVATLLADLALMRVDPRVEALS